MTVDFWFLGFLIYIAFICLLARCVGFNELDGDPDRAAAERIGDRRVVERRLRTRASS